jgi:hypothetical protein
MNSVSSNAVRQAITAALAPISGNVTLTDTTMSMNGTLIKSGKVCNLQLRIWKEGEITVTNGQVLCTIPEGFRPLSHAWLEIQNFNSSNAHQLITIDNYGNVYCVLQQTYERLDFYLSVSWITA